MVVSYSGSPAPSTSRRAARPNAESGGTYWDRDQDKKILIRNPGRRGTGGNWIPSRFIHELGLPE